MRAVLDVNLLISSVLSPKGTPARLIRAWHAGVFELVVSPSLLGELERVLAYPKLAALVEPEAAALLGALRSSATLVADPQSPPPVAAADPADDYLLALAAAADAAVVSGDRDLLDLAPAAPVFSPADFLQLLG